MKERIKVVYGKAKTYFVGMTRRQKIIWISGAVAFVILLIIFIVALNTKDYVPLFEGLTGTENKEVLSRLEELGEEYEVDGTKILVLRDREDYIRMQMNIEGFPQSGVNQYDMFGEIVGSLTVTDFQQKTVLKFQLEQRLSETIKMIDKIRNAVVTLAIPENKSMIFQEDVVDPSASVTVDIQNGGTLDHAQVEGIRRLVATSVSGLLPENVSIVDTFGNELMQSSYTQTSELTRTKLELERLMSKEITEKVYDLLIPAFGREKISVSVATSLNFDDFMQKSTKYTPSQEDGNKGVVSEDHIINEYIISSGTEGEIGTQPNAEFDDEGDITDYGDEGDTEGLVQQRKESATDYKVDSVEEYLKRNVPIAERISIGIIVDTPLLTDEEIEVYQEIVRQGTGATQVTLAYTEFVPAPEEMTAFQAFLREGNNFIIFFSVLLMIILAIAIMAIMIIISNGKRRLLYETAAAEEAIHYNLGDYFGEDGQPLTDTEMPVEAIQVSDSKDQQLKRQISDFAVSNPEIVAQLLRTWLKGEADNYE